MGSGLYVSRLPSPLLKQPVFGLVVYLFTEHVVLPSHLPGLYVSSVILMQDTFPSQAIIKNVFL